MEDGEVITVGHITFDLQPKHAYLFSFRFSCEDKNECLSSYHQNNGRKTNQSVKEFVFVELSQENNHNNSIS